jgi:hypothetical protein
VDLLSHQGVFKFIRMNKSDIINNILIAVGEFTTLHLNAVTFYCYRHGKSALVAEIGRNLNVAADALGQMSNGQDKTEIFKQSMKIAIDNIKAVYEDREFWKIVESGRRTSGEEKMKRELDELDQLFQKLNI